MDDLDTFRAMLRVNKHRLDEELEVQAEIMGRISDRMAAVSAKSAEAEQDLKAIEARLFRQFKDDDQKLTDKAADSAIKRHQDRVRAFERSVHADKELAQWQGLYAAWKARGFSINSLCDLYLGQYYTKDSHSSKVDQRRSEESALQERRPYVRSVTSGGSPRRRISEG
jgi:hypothetical protein